MRGRIKGKGGVQVKEIANTVTKKRRGRKRNKKKNHQHFKLERNVGQRVGVEGAQPGSRIT